MRAAIKSLAWEFWGANRRGWTLVLATVPLCALLYRLLPGPIDHSDALEFYLFLPFVASIILATAMCNFTDRLHHGDVSGFPRHLFARPIKTHLLVACVMSCAVASVVGIYVAWATLVFQPLGIRLLIRWPATVIAAGIVLYQSIIWILSGFRLTRVIILSLVVSILVGMACIPDLKSSTADMRSAHAWDIGLSIGLIAVAACAYSASVVTISLQRRGASIRWSWRWKLFEKLLDAVPRRAPALRSADMALTWMEWRTGGLLLPAAVGLAVVLILGPAMAITGRGPKATFRATEFLVLLPIVLAYPIGKGLAKPNLWTLDLALTPFVAARPITAAQIVAAKMKSAAWSTLTAWTTLFVLAMPWVYATCNLKTVREFGNVFATIYSPISLWLIAILAVISAMLLTWSLLVGSIWLGQSGRHGVYYSIVGVSLAAYLVLLLAGLIWLVDSPAVSGERFVGLLPWLPWVLAALVTAKTWAATAMLLQARKKRLISDRSATVYVCLWLAVTVCLVALACVLSPRVLWLRDTLILGAILALPLARLAAAPLAVAWNRHR